MKHVSAPTDLPIGRDRALWAIVLLALAIRLVFFTGFLGSDDSSYAEDAVALRDGRFALGADMVSMRVGLVAQAALSYLIFGVSEWSSALPGLVASILTLIVLYGIARIVQGRDAALITAVLFAWAPLNVLYSSTLLPEVPMGLPTALAVLLFLMALRAESSKAAALLSLSAGISVGFGYLMKEPAAIVIAAFPLVGVRALLRRDARSWVYLLPIVGFAGLFLIENAVYLWSSGELLHRFHTIAVTQAAAVATSATERQLQSLWLYPRSMFAVINQVGLTFYLLFGFALLAARRRWPTPLVVMLWFAIPFLYLEFGSTSLTSFNALPKQPRYLEAVTAPAILLIAVWMARWLRDGGPRSRPLLYGFLATYAVTSLTLLTVSHLDKQAVSQPIRETARFLDTVPLRPIHATSIYANALPFLSSSTRGVRVHRVCLGCSVGPCTVSGTAPLSGEVWAVPPAVRDSSDIPSVSECARWRVLTIVRAEPTDALRRTVGPIVSLLGRLLLQSPLAQEAHVLQRLLEPRYVAINIPVEAM